jgi:hypothetical protein
MRQTSSASFWMGNHHPRLIIVLGIFLGMVLGTAIAYFAP